MKTTQVRTFACSGNEILTIVPPDSFAALNDASCEAAPAYAAEDSVRLRVRGQLTVDLMDEARVSLPQDRVVVRGDHDAVILSW